MSAGLQKPPAAQASAHSLGQSAGELISAGVQLIQIRTEKQLMVAQQRARDESRFANKLLAEAAEAGDDFYYSIPYKNHKPDCNNRRNCNCPSTPVEGAGVGLARSAARLWGNCSVETTIEQDLPDSWLVGAWFVDFETNFTKHETKRVSKMKPTRGGGMVVARDKDLDVVYQQGASKIERDVILRALPRHVIERAFETAKAAALQDKMPIKDQIARLIRRFGEVEVRLPMIEKYLGHPFTEGDFKKAEKDAREQCAHLRGLLTAIKGGELEVADVFGERVTPTTVTKAPPSDDPAAVNLDDLEGERGPDATAAPATTAAEASAENTSEGADLTDEEAWKAFKGLADRVAESFNGERVLVKEAPKKSEQWFTSDSDLSAKSVRVYDGIGKKLAVSREDLAKLFAKLEGMLQ